MATKSILLSPLSRLKLACTPFSIIFAWTYFITFLLTLWGWPSHSGLDHIELWARLTRIILWTNISCHGSHPRENTVSFLAVSKNGPPHFSEQQWANFMLILGENPHLLKTSETKLNPSIWTMSRRKLFSSFSLSRYIFPKIFYCQVLRVWHCDCDVNINSSSMIALRALQGSSTKSK